MSCFKKTNDGNKEMTMFTIAKQSKQLTLACKSKKIKISFYICTFRKLSKTNINLLIDAKQEWFFLGLNMHEFPRSKKRAAGELFSHTFL